MFDIFGKKKAARLEEELLEKERVALELQLKLRDAELAAANIAKEAEEEERLASRTPKEIATGNDEPYVDLVSIDLDPEDPSKGTIEFDWNEQFITMLQEQGYPSNEPAEVIVDMWYTEVSKNIAMEVYENADANNALGIGLTVEELENNRKGYS